MTGRLRTALARRQRCWRWPRARSRGAGGSRSRPRQLAARPRLADARRAGDDDRSAARHLHRPVHHRAAGARCAAAAGPRWSATAAPTSSPSAAADVTIDGFAIRGSGLDLARIMPPSTSPARGSSSPTTGSPSRCTGSTCATPTAPGSSGNTIVGRSETTRAGRSASGTASSPARASCAPCRSTRTGAATASTSGTRAAMSLPATRSATRATGSTCPSSTAPRCGTTTSSTCATAFTTCTRTRNRFERNVFTDNAAGAALMFSKGIDAAPQPVRREPQPSGLRCPAADGRRHDASPTTRSRATRSGCSSRAATAIACCDNRVAGNHIGIRVSDSSDGNVFAGNRFAGNVHPSRPAASMARIAGRSTAAGTTGTMRAGWIWTVTESPICRTASWICSATCGGRFRRSGCWPAARASACCGSSTRGSRFPASPVSSIRRRWSQEERDDRRHWTRRRPTGGGAY